MIKINTKGFDAKISDLNKLKSVVDSRAVIELMADMAVAIVFERTTAGKGLTSETTRNPRLKKLKALSVSYKRHRRRVKSQLSSRTGPGRSNLTFSGQMLDALDSKILKTGFRLLVKKTRRSKSRLTNNKVAEFVAKNGRAWLGLAASEQRVLAFEWRRIVRQLAIQVFN